MTLIDLKLESFEKEAKQSNLPVIIDFWASWCGPCQVMGPIFEELSKEYEGKLKFAKINTDEESVLANQFSIRGIPCLIVMNKGVEIDRIVGLLSKAELKQKIDYIINGQL